MAAYSPFNIIFSTYFLFAFAIAGKQHHSLDLLRPAIGFGKEKMSHLHFYFHDIVSSRNPTAVQVAAAQTTRKWQSMFGAVFMIDDALTEGPEPTSKLVGRAQGLYASASQDTLGLLMAMNFAFMDGKYNGSTLSVLGRNAVFLGVREMPVVGGSGVFRFARGYALAHTHWLDPKTADAIVEYNVYVMHY
ncbi:dirigent protein 22 [Cinnamomum micranthum f. kanehirae]|uniref:Dirigent protein n=1 Tax=Cinnamomum micranthum f. kanehirae TaxID=337451 RepID=A0A443NUS5_9MAGN|nr:dirigent protein 22 [Cinnamomum micranthum f. kanehirae]